MLKEKKIIAKIPLRTLGCKGIAIISAIILLMCCFSFSASAEVNNYDYSLNGFTITNMFVDVYDSNGTLIEVQVRLYQPAPYNDRLEVYASRLDGQNWQKGQKYYVGANIEANNSYSTSNNYVIGSFDICFYNTYFKMTNYNGNYFRNGYQYIDDDLKHVTQKADIKPVVLEGALSGIHCDFPKGILGYGYSNYAFYSEIECLNNYKDLGLFLCNIDFDILSAEEYASQSALDKEKEEAESSGNDSMDQLAEAVPNYSDNVLEAFQNLVNSMSHNNTDCVITMPAIKVPKINKYFNEIVLMNEKEIDISNAVNYFPESLIEIIRGLFSAALILYCVKELYGILEYIFVLGGNRN